MKRRQTKGGMKLGAAKAIDLDLGRPNSEPQKQFFAAREKYVCYGGARGGGKTWASRTKVVGMCFRYPGIKILFVRREYEDLRGTIIDPIISMIPDGMATYNEQTHIMWFANGSMIRFGNLPGYGAAIGGKYQGFETDVLCIEEATQFTESEFRALCACVRGVNEFPKKVILTCNPGGIGHAWVKRLFVEGRFKPGENPADYRFIKATVDDNIDLINSNPDYVNALELLPEDIRAAHRYGDWDALMGSFFGEFDPKVHVCQPFEIPQSWARYRAFDYGLDMFACLWVAVDPKGKCYVYREFAEKDMIVSESAETMKACTMEDEKISYTIAPPDMWFRSKDSGKCAAEVYMQHGVPLVKASNSRVQGWLAVKELLKKGKDGKPGIVFFNTCHSLIEFLPILQHDDNNPSDVAKKPHEITHVPDALRYFCVMRTLPGKKIEILTAEDEEIPDRQQDYNFLMCGGKPTQSYMFS